MTAYMLDTNVFNELLDGHVSIDFRGRRLVATHVQMPFAACRAGVVTCASPGGSARDVAAAVTDLLRLAFGPARAVFVEVKSTDYPTWFPMEPRCRRC